MKIKNVIAILLCISLSFNLININVYADNEISTNEQSEQIEQGLNSDEIVETIDLKIERNNLRNLYTEVVAVSKENVKNIPNKTKLYLIEIFESDEINVSSNDKLVINEDGQQDRYIVSFNINDIEFDLDTIYELGIDFFIRNNNGLSVDDLRMMVYFLKTQYDAEVSLEQDKITVIDNMIINMFNVFKFIDYFTEYNEGNIIQYNNFSLEEKFSMYQIFNRFNVSEDKYAVKYINQIYDGSDNIVLLTIATAIFLARTPNEYFVTIITNTDKKELQNYINDALNIDGVIFEFNSVHNYNEITEDTDLVITDYDSYSSAITYDITQLFKYQDISDLLDGLNITDVNILKENDENIVEVNFKNLDDSFKLFDYIRNGEYSYACQTLHEKQKENLNNIRNKMFETIDFYIPYDRLGSFVCDNATDIIKKIEEPLIIDNNVITDTNSVVAFNSFTEGIAFTKDLSQIEYTQILYEMGFYLTSMEYFDIEDVEEYGEDVIVKIESAQAKVYAKNQEKLNKQRITQKEAEEKYSKEVVEKIQEELGNTKLDYIKTKYDEDFVDEVEFLYNNDQQKLKGLQSSYTNEQIQEIISEIQNPKISDQMWFALSNYEQSVLLANIFNINEVVIISSKEIDEYDTDSDTMVINSMDLIESNITSILTSLCKTVKKYQDKKTLDNMIVAQTNLEQAEQELIELKNEMSNNELDKISRIEKTQQEEAIISLLEDLYPYNKKSKFQKALMYCWDIITYTVESYLPKTNFNKYRKIKYKIKSNIKKFNKVQNKFSNIVEQKNNTNTLFNGIKYDNNCFYFVNK